MRNSISTLRVLLIVVSLGGALFIAGCDADADPGPPNVDVDDQGIDDDDPLVDDPGLADEAEDLDARIIEDPDRFVGERVTFTARVVEVIGPNAVRVSGSEATDDAITAFAERVPNIGDEGKPVRVAGTVHIVAQDSFEELFGLEWSEEYADLIGFPGIAATRIELAGG